MSTDARLRALRADITTLKVDAIVNAANERMLGGGGVDGASHRAAGPGRYEECKRAPEVRPGVRCPTGEARITGGHRLPAAWVIHTVGPVWHGGRQGEPELLAACYRNALVLAGEHGLRSIAFPAISCGVYGYPPELATRLAVHSVRESLKLAPSVVDVQFACFGEELLTAYQVELGVELGVQP